MSTIVSDYTDSNLFLTKYISSGTEIFQKCKEFNDKVSEVVEESFAQFFLEMEPKINEWNQTIQSKNIKILDNEKLDELKSIVTSLQAYLSQIQKISKIFIESVLTKIEDLQSFQQLIGLTTDSDKAQTYLNRGMSYYIQDKYDKAFSACSQAIALNEDLDKAYLYRKASLDALSSTERKKCLVDIGTTTCNFRLCAITETDIDDITDALVSNQNGSITLNLCQNELTDQSIEKWIALAKKNPYVKKIEIEKGKRSNTEFFATYREGINQLQKGNIPEAIHSFLKALNRDLHNPTGIASLLEALKKQQGIFSYHQQAITEILSIDDKILTGSLDSTLCIANGGNIKKFKMPQPVTALRHLNAKTVVTGHSNGLLIVWNINPQIPFPILEQYLSQAVCSLLRLSDDQFISYDGLTLKWWNMKQGERLLSNLLGSNKCVKTVNEKNATALELLSDGNLVIASKSILKIFDCKNYKVTEEIDTNYTNSSISKIKELNNGKLVIGYADGYLQIFDKETKKFEPIKVVSDSQRAITTLAILNDKYWMSGDQNGQVKIWDEKYNCLSHFETNSTITSLFVDAVGRTYIGCQDGFLHYWQPPSKSMIPIDDDSLLKSFKINGDLVAITKDAKGRDDMIARGGFGTVYRGLYNNKLVAIKESQDEKELAAEIKMMAQMHEYPTLLSLEGFVQEKDKLQLVMEFMTQGTLTSFLKNSSNLSWETRWVLMMDIVYGLLCLHVNNIVHRDIKTDNILINNNRARISDFGTARKNIKTQTNQIIGTLGYLDPWLDESKNDRYTEKNDIYSLGNVIWVLINEKYEGPWEKISNIRDYNLRLVVNNEKLKIPDKTPSTLKAFLPSLWEKLCNKRPNITTVFEKISMSREEFQNNDRSLQTTALSQQEALKPLPLSSSNKLNVLNDEIIFYESVKNIIKEVLRYYLLATDKNLADAQYELGYCYENGKGIKSDLTKAIYWYQKAANQGHINAQKALVDSVQIQSIAFGKEMWATHLGDIGEEPPLPPDIKAILNAPCPFFPGKKVAETHLLVLIPKTVNGKPLTLKSLGELVKKPLKGTPTYYDIFFNDTGEYKDLPVANSHWVLMTREFIPGSKGKNYVDQQKFLNSCVEKKKLTYEIASILDLTACIFMEFLRSGTRLYGSRSGGLIYSDYVRCQEKYNNASQLGLGVYTIDGLRISHSHDLFGIIGIAGMRKFL